MTATWRFVNMAATVVWLLLLAPAFMLGWLESVVFVSAISLYANVASHLAAWRADENPELEARLARIERLLGELLLKEASA